MNIIKVNEKDEWNLPKKHIITETKRRLVVRRAWSSTITTLDKDNRRKTISQYNRRPPQKPYVKEGTVEIDGEVYTFDLTALNKKARKGQ